MSGGNGLHVSGGIRARDIATWLPIGIALIGSIVAIILWATASLAAKASGDDLGHVRDRVQSLEACAARMETDTQWIKSALWALTQRAGVVVPPPPGGTP